MAEVFQVQFKSRSKIFWSEKQKSLKKTFHI